MGASGIPTFFSTDSVSGRYSADIVADIFLNGRSLCAARPGKEKEKTVLEGLTRFYYGPPGTVQVPLLQLRPDAQSALVLHADPGAPVFPGPPAPGVEGIPVVTASAVEDDAPADFGSTQYPPLHDSPPRQSASFVQSLFSTVSSVHFPQFMHGLQAW